VQNNLVKLLYQFLSYAALFVVLGFACIIIPKTKLISANTYFSLALFSTVVLTGLYFAIQLLKKESYNLAFSIYDVVFVCFIALLFLSAIWARNPGFAFNVSFQWLMFYVVYKLVQHFSYKEKQLHKLLLILTIFFSLSVSIVVFLFLYNADYSGKLTSVFSADQFGLIRRKFGLHRNFLSSFLVLGTGIPLYWLVKGTYRWQVILSILFIGILAFALMLSRSRGSLLAFVFIIGLFYFFVFFKKITSLKRAGICVVSILCGIYLAFILQANESSYAFFLNPLYGVQSAEGDGRLQMWEISFKLINEQPLLGYGAGSWEFEYQKYGAGDLKNHNYKNYFHVHPHNYYIDILFSTGMPGLVCFIFLILFYPIYIVYKKNRKSKLGLVDFVLLSGISSFNIISMFYGIGYNNSNVFLGHPLVLFIFIGMLNSKEKLLSQYRIMFKNKKYNNVVNLYKQLSNKAPIFLARKINLHEKQSSFFFKQKQFALAEKALKKELWKHPYNFVLWKKLGDISFELKKYAQAKYNYKQALLYNCDYIPASIKLLKTEKKLKNYKNIEAIKNELLYINSYIEQFESNKVLWGKHKKLANMYRDYKRFKKSIDNV